LSENSLEDLGDVTKRLFGDPVLQKRLAKFLALQCFRNSRLEGLHAGVAPSSKTGDYSDVVVRTPFGEIPWPQLSRFDDIEMKALMIDVVNRTYEIVRCLFSEKGGGTILRELVARDVVPKWDDPS
jgi:hypothetical protein